MNHDLSWKAMPAGLARFTPWGYLARCACGWEQAGLAGTKKQALHAYRAHKETA